MPLFQLPVTLDPGGRQALLQAFLVDRNFVPWFSSVDLKKEILTVQSRMEEEGSGRLSVLVPVEGHGLIVAKSCTLLERSQPYSLLIELIRGKIYSLQVQIEKWQQAEGLELSSSLIDEFGSLKHQFGELIHSDPGSNPDPTANQILSKTFDLANQLIQHQSNTTLTRSPRFSPWLGYQLNSPVPGPEFSAQLRTAFNSVRVPMNWKQIEAQEGNFDWRETDAQIAWALAQGYHLQAGPLIDFSMDSMPEWLNHWDLNLASFRTLASAFVESAIRRYGQQIRHWKVTANTNLSDLFHFTEDELLGLTGRLVESINQVNSALRISIGLSQPFGDYLTHEPRIFSPFSFVDHLVRFGVHLASIDLEIIMGIPRRGSLFRDPLETLQMIEDYSQIGLPFHITLGFPSSPERGANPDHGLVEMGMPQGGYTEETQAKWMEAMTAMLSNLPLVESIEWLQLLDKPGQMFASCGLLHADLRPKSILAHFQSIQQKRSNG